MQKSPIHRQKKTRYPNKLKTWLLPLTVVLTLVACGSPEKSGGDKANVHITDLENRLKQALGTQVGLRHRNGKGTITIKYFSEDDLERVLALLGVEAK